MPGQEVELKQALQYSKNGLMDKTRWFTFLQMDTMLGFEDEELCNRIFGLISNSSFFRILSNGNNQNMENLLAGLRRQLGRI